LPLNESERDSAAAQGDTGANSALFLSLFITSILGMSWEVLEGRGASRPH